MTTGDRSKVITPTPPFIESLMSLNDACFRARDMVKSSLHWMNAAHRRLTRRNADLRDRHKGARCFVLGTSPSIGAQDLKALAGEHTIAVNFFYKHADAVAVRPKYWVVQDKKLWRGGWPQELIGSGGTWPETMLHDIFATNPETELFLPVAGSSVSAVADAASGRKVRWIGGGKSFVHPFRGPIDLAGAGITGNVMQVAVGIAEYMGFQQIYLLGISLDGLLRDLGGQPSHFYSAPPENRHLEYTSIERDLIMSGFGFRSWRALAEYYEKRNIEVVNLTPDGHLSILPRKSLADVIGVTP